MRGTPLQRRVWEKLRAIRIGRTVSYTEVARWISPLASPRVVAGACALTSVVTVSVGAVAGTGACGAGTA